ncbi:MAG: sigma 54-interacting transcriptional regulator [bacterium]
MDKKPKKILESILLPFILVFLTIFLTHMGMQTQFIDQELDKLTSNSMVAQMQFIRNHFLTDEVRNPLLVLQYVADSIFPGILHGASGDQNFFSPYLKRLRNDLNLDHIALYDLEGKILDQKVLSSHYEKADLTEFQNLIKQGKVTREIFGFDKADQGLVLKIIFPVHGFQEETVGYLSAIRSLGSHFFQKIQQPSNLDILLFKDEHAVFSTIPAKTGEPLSIPPEIQKKVLKANEESQQSVERIFIFGTQYYAVSFPFQNLRGKTVGTLMLVAGLDAKAQSLKKIVLYLLWAGVIGIILLISFGFLISKGITTPLERLIQATHRVSAGDLNTRARIQSHRELITLSQAFNTMTENLQHTLVSKNYFHTIIDTINDLLIIISPEQTITFVNQATLRVLGYDRAELIGKPIGFLFHKDYPVREMDLNVLAQQGTIEDYSCGLVTKSGESIPVSFSGWPMLDEQKRLSEIVGIARDIREKAEAERKIKEERDKLNTLINTINDLIFIRDSQGKVIFISHAVQDILGYSPQEFTSLPYEAVLSSNPINQSFLESPTRLCTRGEDVEPYWTEFLARDGKRLILEINEAPLLGKKGEVIQIMGVGRDISERKKLEEQLREWQEKQAKMSDETYRFGNIIGKSRKMQEIYELIKIVSQSNSTVLIQGESGTGKELIAQAIHCQSPRRDHPFIEVTCSVLSEQLLESELFGHVKGAFTGAIADKPGRFEQADGGTIFLDEIGEVSLNEQVKLLRVVQEREVVRVGGNKRIKVNVRIIAATNKNLKEAVAQGSFREDLYYRLNVVPVLVPPLRERKEDLPLMVNHFIQKMNKKIGKEITGISQKALNILWKEDWPGNVRQLENTIEYAVVRCRDQEIKVRDLPSDIHGIHSEDTTSVQDLLANVQKSALIDVLEDCQWNMTQAAQKLNISRTTLWRKIRKYDVAKPDNLGSALS